MISQIELIGAICTELDRQGVKSLCPWQYNTIIRCVDELIVECEKETLPAELDGATALIASDSEVSTDREKLVAKWECVVTESRGDSMWCDAYPLGQASIEREFWEVGVPDNEWTEGDVFYVLRSQQ